MSIRALKTKARRAIHDRLGVPAIYVDPITGSETACRVRVHDALDDLGSLAGYDYGPTERVHTTPVLIFWYGEITLMRSAMVSVGIDEAYVIQNVDPPHGETVAVEVTKMKPDALATANLPLPLPEPI